MWNLLMVSIDSDIDSQGADGLDEDKQKWWEDERKMLHERANSFITRMRLVQGDRRFSPWKGSVIDSVVGVFLTQLQTIHQDFLL
uniref:Protein ROS1 n=1 Tax=Noccaea caerulescens TaxID=107243 RepID=A0A1J3E7K8_NOCCA